MRPPSRSVFDALHEVAGLAAEAGCTAAAEAAPGSVPPFPPAGASP